MNQWSRGSDGSGWSQVVFLGWGWVVIRHSVLVARRTRVGYTRVRWIFSQTVVMCPRVISLPRDCCSDSIKFIRIFQRNIHIDSNLKLEKHTWCSFHSSGLVSTARSTVPSPTSVAFSCSFIFAHGLQVHTSPENAMSDDWRVEIRAYQGFIYSCSRS
jgi:hypothetical protein